MKKILSFCLSVFLLLSVSAAEEPSLKIVVTTDIHAQWQLLEKVYAFMAEKNPDAVLFAGDLARYVGDAKSYKTYISIYNKYFSKCKTKPVHIPITGNHDYWEHKGKKRLAPQDSLKRFFHPMGMKADWLQHHVIKGYTFIGISATDEKGENNHTPEEIRQVSGLIGEAEKKAPGKPVFVLTHCPPAFTMAASARNDGRKKVWDWRYDHIRKMLSGHKQVISISGHTHLPLQDERTIWQGEFTAINAGGLYKTALTEPGPVTDSHIPYNGPGGQSFCYIEVFRNHMLIYRYDANTLKEIAPEKRWRVKLPYDPEKAIYTMNRKNSSEVPRIPAGTTATVIKKINKNGKEGYALQLNLTQYPDSVYAYKVKLIYDDKSLKNQEFYIVSDFFQPERSRNFVYQFPQNQKLTAGAECTLKIIPVEQFGKTGKGISLKCKIP